MDDSYFGASNFTIEYGDGNPLWLLITFLPNRDFYYKVQKATIGSIFLETQEAPGVKLIRADSRIYQSFEECLKSIPAWTARIKEEIIDSNPIAREMQAVRQQLENRIDTLAEQQEEFFTQKEADELSAKLHEFSERLDTLTKTNEDLVETVNNLKHKLSELGDAASSVNKGTWLRMASSRLTNAVKSVLRSKEASDLALEATKKILLE